MKKYLSILLLFCVMVTDIFAQGESAVPFLLIAPGARAGGMGESGVATPNDATAIYWNPAGMAGLRNRELNLMHAEWLPQFKLDDMYYDFLAYSHFIEDVGTVGLGITYLSLGENAYTTTSSEVLDTFSSYEVAFSLGYGTDVNENLAIGLATKFIYSNLSGDFTAGAEKGSGSGSSVAVDLGVLYKSSFFIPFTFGATLTNVGPKISYIDVSQADPLPTTLRLGTAFHLLNSEYNKMVFSVESYRQLVVRDDRGQSDSFYQSIFTTWSDGSFNEQIKEFVINGGLEYIYSDLISLRAGGFYEDPDNGARKFLTVGAGLRYSIINFDFGYISTFEEGHPLADTMRFSLRFLF